MFFGGYNKNFHLNCWLLLGMNHSNSFVLETVYKFLSPPVDLLLKLYSGWGRTVTGGAGSNLLQQAILPVQSHQRCSEVNSILVPVDETSMICAGSGKANQPGGCQGDSGGPFVCNEGGKWVLRGVVSWGHYRCSTEHFTVFARLSSFINWIDVKMSDGNLFHSFFIALRALFEILLKMPLVKIKMLLVSNT